LERETEPWLQEHDVINQTMEKMTIQILQMKKHDCKRRVLKIEGKIGEGTSSHRRELINTKDGQNSVKSS
jgi:hypothetical protein